MTEFFNINFIPSCLGILVVSVMFLCFQVGKFVYIKRHILSFSRKLKGYTFYPLIGNGYYIMGKNILTALQDIVKKFGLPCNVWFGHDYNYLTDDAQEIKIILTHPNTFDKNIVYTTLKLAFDDTLLLAPVEVWKRHRKFYAKSFSQPILNSFVQYYYDKSSILLEVLKDSEKKDMFEIFGRFAFDSFCASIIGIDYNLQVQPRIQMVEIIGELQELIGKRLTSSYFYIEKIWFYMAEGRRALYLLNTLKTIVNEILEQKRKEFKNKEVASMEDEKTLPLLDSMLLNGPEEFDDDFIFKEMFLFTTAATDTSGNTLAYTFTLLGMNPDIQEKVYEEIVATVGLHRPIYYDDLPHLKYTERCILEAMRLLPVVPLLGRQATDDVNLGSKIIPKGANILISVFNLHRNEKYWTDPLKYEPDRFLQEEVAKRSSFAFIPFSGGSRNCIGKTYAMMLMKTCVANVIRNYKVFSQYKSVSEFNLVSCVTMKTEDNLNCSFKLRSHH